MSEAYKGLEPREVWRHFAALNQIPRPSGHEEKARDYVRQIARECGATTQEDSAGNIVVRVAGNNASTHMVAIQSHLDMVCEKRPDVQHDFASDAIVPRREGDKIYASGTTLGADNGIGAAMALAALTSNISHGPLELLFTVEEETGLHGAMKLDENLLRADYLINLDSEDPDEITVGCAGGAGTSLILPLQREVQSEAHSEVVESQLFYEIVVSGLQGGHSGIQIHEPLANAIKVLIRVLDALPDFHLVSIDGGNAHNAIPRDATAIIVVASTHKAGIENAVLQIHAQLQNQWQHDEPSLEISLRETPVRKTALTQNSHNTLLQLLRDVPHGVLQMSETFAGKVETSANLATVQTRDADAEIHISVRSFIASELDNVQAQLRVLGESASAKIEVRDGYPGWEPRAESGLLQTAREIYPQIYGVAPKVEVVHAGLECGAIVSKYPGMEAVSFGPLIRGPHTPEEWVSISSVEQSWQFLEKLLARL
jgi:dipeptidase D